MTETIDKEHYERPAGSFPTIICMFEYVMLTPALTLFDFQAETFLHQVCPIFLHLTTHTAESDVLMQARPRAREDWFC